MPLFFVLCPLLMMCQQAEKPEVSFVSHEEFRKANLPFSEAVIVGNMIYLSGQVGSTLERPMVLVGGGIKSEAGQALENIKRSGSKYFMTTTFPGEETNANIDTGGWRPLNLEKPPFQFPPPLYLLNEQCTEMDGAFADKSMGVWEVGMLPVPVEWLDG